MAERPNSTSLLRDVFRFFKDHWGEIYFIIDVVGNVIGKKPPIDKEGRIDYGGLGKSKDEITIDQIEITLTPEEQEAITHWHRWVRSRYGPSGFLGWVMKTYYLNKFRMLIMHMIEPPKKKVEKIMKKDKGGNDVLDKIVETEDTSSSRQEAKAFLERFTAQIISGMNEHVGTPAEKIDAGCLRACEYLKNKSMPTPRFSKGVQTVDDFVSNIPGNTTKAVRGRATAVVTWNKNLNETTAAKEARLPLWRRIMRF